MARAKNRRGGRPNQTGRNDGEQYINLPYVMLQSPAWRSLSGPAAKLWLELRTRFHGTNNGRLLLSYEDAARLLHLSKSTCSRAFKELEDKGFITLTRQGQWYGRLASEWSVTDKGVDGASATRAWRQWQPPEPIKSSVPRRHAKTEIGTEAAPLGNATVPPEYR